MVYLNGECYLSDATDLWDMYVQRHLIDKACKKIISKNNGFTTSNCFTVREGTAYWASAEASSTYAWFCSTNYSFVDYWRSKWDSLSVRPVFALSA